MNPYFTKPRELKRDAVLSTPKSLEKALQDKIDTQKYLDIETVNRIFDQHLEKRRAIFCKALWDQLSPSMKQELEKNFTVGKIEASEATTLSW